MLMLYSSSMSDSTAQPNSKKSKTQSQAGSHSQGKPRQRNTFETESDSEPDNENRITWKGDPNHAFDIEDDVGVSNQTLYYGDDCNKCHYSGISTFRNENSC